MTGSQRLLERVAGGAMLSRAEAELVLEELLGGRMETPEIVWLLESYNRRAITVPELAGFAGTMRRHAAQVFREGEERPRGLVDTCGTGGDASGTFNISTAAAIVAAAAGARVAKHGNRGSSKANCGSADVLEALGVRVDHRVEHGARALREMGLAFFFARTAHSAARHAAPARAQIGKRTFFNLLGPLTNPAGADTQVLGVFSADVLDVVAATLVELGVRRAFVVHGADGLDEITVTGETHVAEVRDGAVRRFTLTPEEFGLKRAPREALLGGSAQENAAIIRRIFDGQAGAAREIVVANAAAALVAAGNAGEFRDGAEKASKAISSGAARAKLEQLRAFSKQD